MRLALLALVTAAVILSPAGRARAADALITEFTVQNLTEILTEMGTAEVVSKDLDGITTVGAKFKGEATYFTMIGCTAGQPCMNLQVWMLYEPHERNTPAFANGFNGQWLDVTAWARPNKTLMLRTLLIANGGLTRDHVKEVFATVLNAPALLAAYVQSQGSAALKPGDAATLSASTPTESKFAPYVPSSGVVMRELVP
jgi:hypothetical protein